MQAWGYSPSFPAGGALPFGYGEDDYKVIQEAAARDNKSKGGADEHHQSLAVLPHGGDGPATAGEAGLQPAQSRES